MLGETQGGNHDASFAANSRALSADLVDGRVFAPDLLRGPPATNSPATVHIRESPSNLG